MEIEPSICSPEHGLPGKPTVSADTGRAALPITRRIHAKRRVQEAETGKAERGRQPLH